MNSFSPLDVPVKWVDPGKWLTTAQARKQAFAAFEAPVRQAVECAWREEAPAQVWPEVNRQVAKGLRECLELLTVSHRHPSFEPFWHPLSCSYRLPACWEPPVAQEPAQYPKEQLQAYRWVAALIALHVRNWLEDVHSKHTSDDSMPALNRGVRDAVYAVLLAEPQLAWKLSDTPRLMVGMAVSGFPIELPAVVG